MKLIKKYQNKCLKRLVLSATVLLTTAAINVNADATNTVKTANNAWQTITCTNQFTARHEAGLVNMGDDIFLLGGRRINPVNILNTESLTWLKKSSSPIELHHFQPVVLQDKIYIVGAMTGKYPNEVPLTNVLIYTPATDTWSEGDEIPAERRRGGAGASVYNNKIYLSGGITQGHMTGTVQWFDEYDPSTGKWQVLADMPHGRDHFQSAVINNKLYAAGGRTTSNLTGHVFDLVINQVNVYDFTSQSWSTLADNLPTGRAGNTTTNVGSQLWVIGGESMSSNKAHKDVEIFDTVSNQWLAGPSLNLGRHGTGAALIKGELWTVSGSGNRGGSPELQSVEKIVLAK